MVTKFLCDMTLESGMVQILGHPLATQTTASFINPRLCWRERFSRYTATFSDLSPDLFLEALLADVLPLT